MQQMQTDRVLASRPAQAAPTATWYGEGARDARVLAAELLALAHRCDAAVPGLMGRVRAAQAELRACLPADAEGRLALRHRLQDAAADLQAARHGAVSARAWAAELLAAAAR